MMTETKQTIFITGAAGYVGAMLVDQFIKRDDVGLIIALDKEARPDWLPVDSKLQWLQTNLADQDWPEKVAAVRPNIIIHTAWQIREMYGQSVKQRQWNIGGSDNLFKLTLTLPSVKKLIYFSSVATYGARSDNSLDYRFTEVDVLKPGDYLYAREKSESEEHLRRFYNQVPIGRRPAVWVLRPVAITGPRGRYMHVRFGLQSALSGRLKSSLSDRLVSRLATLVPITKKWCRQFIHEDDVADIVARLAFGETKAGYEVLNICPPGPVVTGLDMARAVGKRAIKVPATFIRMVFACLWHLSGGKIPTSRGGWRSYAYPIVVDGSKLTKKYGYHYRCQSLAAFTQPTGRYAKYIPADKSVNL